MNIPNVNNDSNPYLMKSENAQPAHNNNPANPEEQVNNPKQEDIFVMSPATERLQNEIEQIQDEVNPNPGGPYAITEDQNPTGEQAAPANENMTSPEEPLKNVEENPEPPEPNVTDQIQQRKARAQAMGMPDQGNILDLNA